MVAPPNHHIRTSHSSPGLIDPESLSSPSRYLACSPFYPSKFDMYASFPKLLDSYPLYKSSSMQKMIIRRSKHMLTEFGLQIQVFLCIGCFGLPSLLIPRGLVGHHLSSRGGISEMFHSCRRPSRQLPLRLRWSIYWRRGGRQQPFLLVLYTLCLCSLLYTQTYAKYIVGPQRDCF